MWRYSLSPLQAPSLTHQAVAAAPLLARSGGSTALQRHGGSGSGSSLSLSASTAATDWLLLVGAMAQRIPSAASIIGLESSPLSSRPSLQQGGEKQHAMASSCVNISDVL
ncbi:Os06g0549375 [Oryza sativa Japonica Group]|uniref:Os06g0549375 protein n=2 Tax=Oryza sativa subsp. japonica TaxID=39947 RepID=Q5Z963_ORYSJ|nr:hypothetical protein [Oryza sativa Japonica Group]BAS98172.1 Os06g0549375 [Oryza sativa Japonica Group]